MKIVLIIAASMNLFIAVIHLFGGEFDVIAPLLKTELPLRIVGTLRGGWHEVSFIEFMTSMILFKIAFQSQKYPVRLITNFIGIMYIGLALIFVLLSFIHNTILPPIFFILPIGILSLWGSFLAKKEEDKISHNRYIY